MWWYHNLAEIWWHEAMHHEADQFFKWPTQPMFAFSDLTMKISFSNGHNQPMFAFSDLSWRRVLPFSERLVYEAALCAQMGNAYFYRLTEIKELSGSLWLMHRREICSGQSLDAGCSAVWSDGSCVSLKIGVQVVIMDSCYFFSLPWVSITKL